MNITKKLFFVLFFALLFFIPNNSKAVGKCKPVKDNTVFCFQYKIKQTCDVYYQQCFWDEYTCAARDICSGNDYGKCISHSLTKVCFWDGDIPTLQNQKSISGVSALPIEVPKIENPLGGINLVNKFIGNIINSVFGFVGSIALLMFIYGGLSWLMAGGSADKIKNSRDTLVWAAIGLVFIFLSYAATSILIKIIS